MTYQDGTTQADVDGDLDDHGQHRTPLQQACRDHMAQILSLPDKQRAAVLASSLRHLIDAMQVAILDAGRKQL